MAQQTTSKPSPEKMADRIRSVWGKLTEEEVRYYETDRPRFCDALKRKYSLQQNEIDRQINSLESELRVAA